MRSCVTRPLLEKNLIWFFNLHTYFVLVTLVEQFEQQKLFKPLQYCTYYPIHLTHTFHKITLLTGIFFPNFIWIIQQSRTGNIIQVPIRNLKMAVTFGPINVQIHVWSKKDCGTTTFSQTLYCFWFRRTKSGFCLQTNHY